MRCERKIFPIPIKVNLLLESVLNFMRKSPWQVSGIMPVLGCCSHKCLVV